jgi:RND family efflux transporter MFP subunit
MTQRLRSTRPGTIVVLLSMSMHALAEAPPPAAPVEVRAVEERMLSATVMAPGTVVSLNDARIAAETGGRLLWVASPGDQIDKGAPLARLDTTRLKLTLEENDATIARLEAGLKYQKQQVERYRELTDRHIAARNQLDEAVSQSEMTRQELNQARVVREQTRHLIARSTVTAPFGGQVVERMRQAGEYVIEGGELVRLVDTRNMEARLQAPMHVAPFIAEGAHVAIEDGSDRRIDAAVRAIIPVADERSRLMEIRVSLPDRAWPIGSAVRGELPASAPVRVVAVPRDAVIVRRDESYVYRVRADETVERIPVETGIGDADFVGVSGDLASGDSVVTRGGERLQHGQRVAVATPQNESQSRAAAAARRVDRG